MSSFFSLAIAILILSAADGKRKFRLIGGKTVKLDKVEVGKCGEDDFSTVPTPAYGYAEECGREYKKGVNNCFLKFGQSKYISLYFKTSDKAFRRATSLSLTVEAKNEDMKFMDMDWLQLEQIDLCKAQEDLKMNGKNGCKHRRMKNRLTYKLKVPLLDSPYDISMRDVDIRVRLVADSNKNIFCGITVVDVEHPDDKDFRK